MGFYAAATTLLASAHESAGKAKKLFYADDGSGGGKLIDILDWWRFLQLNGPALGFFPDASKTWLVVKPEFEQKARELFPDVNINNRR